MDRLCPKLEEHQIEEVALGTARGQRLPKEKLPKDMVIQAAKEHAEWHRFLGLLRYWAERALRVLPGGDQLKICEVGKRIYTEQLGNITTDKIDRVDQRYFHTVAVDLLGKFLPTPSEIKKKTWSPSQRNGERVFVLRQGFPTEELENTRTKLAQIIDLIPEDMVQLFRRMPGETKRQASLRTPKETPLPSLSKAGPDALAVDWDDYRVVGNQLENLPIDSADPFAPAFMVEFDLNDPASARRAQKAMEQAYADAERRRLSSSEAVSADQLEKEGFDQGDVRELEDLFMRAQMPPDFGAEATESEKKDDE